MIDLDRSYIQTTIQSLTDRKQRLRWLTEHDINADRVANFGCNIGGETLALMWALGADECIGIDKDEDSIQQAKSTLAFIKEDIERIRRMLSYYPSEITAEDKTWWNAEVPEFFKRELLREESHVTYVVSDFTLPTSLPEQRYDVAFCDFVLHHIWYDQARENAEGDTKFAIREMARVVKPRGLVAAFELIQYSDMPKLDFGQLFGEVGLEKLHQSDYGVDTIQGPVTVSECIFRKPEVV